MDLNLGFADDTEFTEKWTAKNNNTNCFDSNTVVNLLTLAADFFTFIFGISAECEGDPCVLNTKGAEIWQKDSISKNPQLITKHTSEELGDLREQMNTYCRSRAIVITHLSNAKWRFSINTDHFMMTIWGEIAIFGWEIKKRCRTRWFMFFNELGQPGGSAEMWIGIRIQ